MQHFDRFCECAVNLFGRKPAAQKFSKEMMVAIPVALVIQRDEEQVALLQLLEHVLTIRALRHSIAERPTELVKKRGVEQEGLSAFLLPLEDLFGQVIEHEAMTAGESREKRGNSCRIA